MPGSTYSYKIQMAGEDTQVPHHYVYASMVVEYDAALAQVRNTSDIKCSQAQ